MSGQEGGQHRGNGDTPGTPGGLLRFSPSISSPCLAPRPPAHPGSESSACFQEAPRYTELPMGLLSGRRLSSKLLLL